MIVPNLGMLLQEGNRSKAYLQKLIKNDLLPNFVLLLRNPNKKEKFNINPGVISTSYFDPNIPEIDSLECSGIPYELIDANSCNDPQVIDSLQRRTEEYFVFSGSGILKKVFEAGKKLIHVHPGKLPEYRGSTCPYYSALKEGIWYTTAFIMEPGIDEGDLIDSRGFDLPKNGDEATRIYDPHTRSELLIEVIEQLASTGTIKTYQQNLSKGTDYYIIHPVLEFIAKKSFDLGGKNE